MIDMTEIMDGLFISGKLDRVAGFSGRRPAAIDVLPDGIDVVIGLETEYQDVISDPRLKACMWFPCDDVPETPLTVNWLATVVDCVEAWRFAHKVLVHCAAGISRSGMIAAACVMQSRKLVAALALDEVRRKRPCVRPNEGFMKLLKDYQGMVF